ncbi:unnamed protein product, partial [Mycena citricolor]
FSTIRAHCPVADHFAATLFAKNTRPSPCQDDRCEGEQCGCSRLEVSSQLSFCHSTNVSGRSPARLFPSRLLHILAESSRSLSYVRKPVVHPLPDHVHKSGVFLSGFVAGGAPPSHLVHLDFSCGAFMHRHFSSTTRCSQVFSLLREPGCGGFSMWSILDRSLGALPGNFEAERVRTCD